MSFPRFPAQIPGILFVKKCRKPVIKLASAASLAFAVVAGVKARYC